MKKTINTKTLAKFIFEEDVLNHKDWMIAFAKNDPKIIEQGGYWEDWEAIITEYLNCVIDYKFKEEIEKEIKKLVILKLPEFWGAK